MKKVNVKAFHLIFPINSEKYESRDLSSIITFLFSFNNFLTIHYFLIILPINNIDKSEFIIIDFIDHRARNKFNSNYPLINLSCNNF